MRNNVIPSGPYVVRANGRTVYSGSDSRQALRAYCDCALTELEVYLLDGLRVALRNTPQR